MTLGSDPSAGSSGSDPNRYSVLPEPQSINLRQADFEFDDSWQLVTAGDSPIADRVRTTFADYLLERHRLSLGASAGAGREIVLALEPDRIAIQGTAERDAARLAEQAYELRLEPDRIRVSAYTEVGLSYGLATLVQLITPDRGRLWLPAGEIVDWPNVSRRYIFWDDSEHLERMDALRAAIRQAALYKVNGFVLKLDSHFQYRSAPAVVDPNALAPEELQALTDYGLRYNVSVIPYLDAPAHLGWLLKHPEYVSLRELPDCNYELSTTDPDSYRLLEGLMQDLLDANQGVDVFVLSTDEPYYIGLGSSSTRAEELGGVGRLEAEFITRIAGFLHDRGRTVQFWGEYPMERTDIPSLPSYLINGINNGPKYDPVYEKNGNRQMVYASTQAELPNFPDYFPLPPQDLVNPINASCALTTLYDTVSYSRTYGQQNVVGVFIAAWADAGLHPETFWLGFICGSSWAWHPGSPEPAAAVDRFLRLFYGPGGTDLRWVYAQLSAQSQFFHSSWDRCDSTSRTPIVGDSYGVFETPRPAHDQRLPLPPVPAPGLPASTTSWGESNRRRLRLARQFAGANDTLLALLRENEAAVAYNSYNLEVLGSIGTLFLQNLELLQDLGRIDGELRRAEEHAGADRPADALASLDCALTLVQAIRRLRNQVLRQVAHTWSKSQHPKVVEANGRRLLHAFDDVKDHLPDRTLDLSYLIQRQLILPLDPWFEQVQAVRNDYAATHHLPTRTESLEWTGYSLDHQPK